MATEYKYRCTCCGKGYWLTWLASIFIRSCPDETCNGSLTYTGYSREEHEED